MTTLTLNLDDGRELEFTAPAVLDRQTVEVFLCDQVPVLVVEELDPEEARKVLSLVLGRDLCEPFFLNAWEAHRQYESVANGYGEFDEVPVSRGWMTRTDRLAQLTDDFTSAIDELCAQFPEPLAAVA